LEDYLWGKDVFDLLAGNLGMIEDVDKLLSVLRPLAPRSYSISSSNKVHPLEVHLTVAAVRYQAEGRQHQGAGSCYLADRVSEGDEVSVYFAPASLFTLPDNDDTSIIMIGPGTGIAPFRGFLQERRFRRARGNNWLFFGDRQAGTDFLYKDELLTYLDEGLLARLDVAFSRDQENKIYVQDRMLENARELFQWLQDGAVVYVCGDATHMAKDVDAALHSIVKTEGGMNSQQAKNYIDELKRSSRYLRDVY